MTGHDITVKNPVSRFFDCIARLIASIPSALIGLIKSAVRGTGRFFAGIWAQLCEIGRAFRYGGAGCRLSFIVMGAGCVANGQIIKGLIYFAAQILFIIYMIGFGAGYLSKLGTLGTQTVGEVFDEEQQIYIYTQGDNSMKILLFAVLSLIIALIFAVLYFSDIKAGYRAHIIRQNGGIPDTFAADIRSLRDKHFHKTLLTAPTIMVSAFTIIPMIFMVLIAFTNYDKNHQPPGNLFTWVGWQNFKDLFWDDPMKSRTFSSLFGWTLVWAFFATFSNYILGMILALMINKKGIKLKKLWRALFVITIAVPQFVSLMLMSQLLQDNGAVNTVLKELGIIDHSLPFLTDATWARVTVILVNMWVGIPYTMLITTGILMNIPTDLYESAKIDGAGPVRTFFSITLPYMLFVTTPYLISQFVGNINNFNVIYLLTKGYPLSTDYYQAGKTDLLITWLYKQTVNEQNYNLASAIGIITFVLVGVISLIVYNKSASAGRESDFQ